MTKYRLFDLCIAIPAVLFLTPAFVLIAIAVKVQDRGPVFFKQERVGYKGKMFRIRKFRSMRMNAEKIGASITRAGDPRVTPVGRVLRKTKLDELPQLFNVLLGEMAMVGPRPEVPRYVSMYSDDQKRVLDLHPGITDVASIEFRNEEELLAAAPEPEAYYMTVCVPRKIELNLAYAEQRTLRSDVMIIVRTAKAVVTR